MLLFILFYFIKNIFDDTLIFHNKDFNILTVCKVLGKKKVLFESLNWIGILFVELLSSQTSSSSKLKQHSPLPENRGKRYMDYSRNLNKLSITIVHCILNGRYVNVIQKQLYFTFKHSNPPPSQFSFFLNFHLIFICP